MDKKYLHYITYRCKACGLEFTIQADGLRKAEVLGRFLACPLGHRPIKETGTYDDIKDCMQHDSYERVGGRIRQRQG